MNLREFFLFFIPILLFLIFIKGFLQNLFLIPMGEAYLALALVVLTHKHPNFLVYLYILILGVINGLDQGLEILTGLFFLLLGMIGAHLRRYVSFEHIKTKLLFWSLSLLGFLMLRLTIFFSEVYFILSVNFIVSLVLKTLQFLVFSFLWVLLFDMIFIKQKTTDLLSHEK